MVGRLANGDAWLAIQPLGAAFVARGLRGGASLSRVQRMHPTESLMPTSFRSVLTVCAALSLSHAALAQRIVLPESQPVLAGDPMSVHLVDLKPGQAVRLQAAAGLQGPGGEVDTLVNIELLSIGGKTYAMNESFAALPFYVDQALSGLVVEVPGVSAPSVDVIGW